MRRLAIVFLLFVFSLSVGECLYFLRKGFSVRRLYPFETGIKASIDSKTAEILSQPFYFLGRGRQCFAFASSDGKYVLKCPRTDIFQIPFWARSLPLINKREYMRFDKTKRQKFVLNSFRIAKDELYEETGTIAIHLGKSEIGSLFLHLVDPIGISHRFPAHETLFILQHKKPLWTPLFLNAQKRGDIETQKQLIDALIEVMSKRAKKGFFNRDRSFLRNYGFDEEKAYQIDVGDFYRLDDLDRGFAFHKSIRDSMAPVQEWLGKIDPPMLSYLNGQLEKIE